MRNSLFVTTLATALACLAGPSLAHAEIYTWIDAKGQMNISNLPPPEGARVTKVVRETPPHANPYNDAAREAAQKAELDNLAQRVDQLQNELQLAARQPPPQPAPQPQFIFLPASAPVQYAPEPAPAASDCGYGWTSCNGWWNPGFPPFVSYVFVPTQVSRPFPCRGGRGGCAPGAHDANGVRGGHRDYRMPLAPPLRMGALSRP